MNSVEITPRGVGCTSSLWKLGGDTIRWNSVDISANIYPVQSFKSFVNKAVRSVSDPLSGIFCVQFYMTKADCASWRLQSHSGFFELNVSY